VNVRSKDQSSTVLGENLVGGPTSMHLLTPPFLPRIAVFCHFKVLMEKGVTEQVGGILPTLHLGEHLAFAAEGTEKRSSFLLFDGRLTTC